MGWSASCVQPLSASPWWSPPSSLQPAPRHGWHRNRPRRRPKSPRPAPVSHRQSPANNGPHARDRPSGARRKPTPATGARQPIAGTAKGHRRTRHGKAIAILMSLAGIGVAGGIAATLPLGAIRPAGRASRRGAIGTTVRRGRPMPHTASDGCGPPRHLRTYADTSNRDAGHPAPAGTVGCAPRTVGLSGVPAPLLTADRRFPGLFDEPAVARADAASYALSRHRGSSGAIIAGGD